MNHNPSKMKSPSGLLGKDDGEQVEELALRELLPFENHPFYVLENEALHALMDSIREHGVMVPIIVRPKGRGTFEIVAGHRRCKASELLGLLTIPAFIRDFDQEDAVLAMVDTNIQRESLLFSEKAFAYKMKLDALKRKAGRPKKNTSPLGEHSSHSSSGENTSPLGEHSSHSASGENTSPLGEHSSHSSSGENTSPLGEHFSHSASVENTSPLGEHFSHSASVENTSPLGEHSSHSSSGENTSPLGEHSSHSSSGENTSPLGENSSHSSSGENTSPLGEHFSRSSSGENTSPLGEHFSHSSSGENTSPLGEHSSHSASGENTSPLGEHSSHPSSGENTSPLGESVHSEGWSIQQVAKNTSDSARNIQRYIRLTELSPDLLQMVDKKTLPFQTGVELSYLSEVEQVWLWEWVLEAKKKPSLTQATQLKKMSQDGVLSQASLEETLALSPVTSTVAFSPKIKNFFQKDTSKEEMESVILQLLSEWKKKNP